MYLRTIVLGFILLTSPTLAQDDPAPRPFRTLDLLMTCRPHSEFEKHLLQCAAYLHGIMDANIMMSMIEGYRPVFCVPKGGIGGLQAMKIFVTWADSHPEQLHLHRRLGTIRAFLAAFPCE